MKQNHKEYMDEMGYETTDYVVINPKIYAKAKEKESYQTFTVPISKPEEIAKVGMGHAVASIEWLKSAGINLWNDYQAWVQNVEVPEASTESNFDKSLNEIPKGNVKEAFGTAAPAPPQEEIDTPVAPPPPAAEDNEYDDEYGDWDFSRYVQRVDYLIKEKGLEHDASARGYVNKELNRFVDGNVVKNYDNPQSYAQYVDERLQTPWEHPVKVTEEVPDITENIEENKDGDDVFKNRKQALIDKGYVPDDNKQEFIIGALKVDYKDIVEMTDSEFQETLKIEKANPKLGKVLDQQKEEVETKRTMAEINDAKNKITDFLKENGFEMNKNTYAWSKGEIVVKHSEINDFATGNMEGWDELKQSFLDEWEMEEHMEADKHQEQVDKVPEEIKEIAKESDNVIIASVPKKEFKKVEPQPDVKNVEKLEVVEEQDVSNEEKMAAELSMRDEKPLMLDDFISKLASFSFSQVKVVLTRKNADNVGDPEEKVTVTVEPLSFEDEPEFLKMKPLMLSGTVKEISEGFWNALDKPLQVTEKLFSNSDKYLKELAAIEKKTKMEKDKADNIKKALEALEKYDKGDKKTEATFKKKIAAVLELDPENKTALEFQDKLNQKTLL